RDPAVDRADRVAVGHAGIVAGNDQAAVGRADRALRALPGGTPVVREPDRFARDGVEVRAGARDALAVERRRAEARVGDLAPGTATVAGDPGLVAAHDDEAVRIGGIDDELPGDGRDHRAAALVQERDRVARSSAEG